MILGQPQSSKQSNASLVNLVILVSNPFALAVGNIAMRSARNLHINVISCWLNLTQIMMFVPLAYT
jgi:hypothetical protein